MSIARRGKKGIFAHYRRVPIRYQHVEDRPAVRTSLRTTDELLARSNAADLEIAQNARWEALLAGRSLDAERYCAELIKTPITEVDLLNDRVLPFYESYGLPMLRILTDRGTEYCGKAEQHPFQLYLFANDIEHTKTKARSPQTNGICERFHKTILQEFYQVTFRKKLDIRINLAKSIGI